MVKLARLPFFLAVALLCLSAMAKDPAEYKVGDTAETDISTPVALDVIDTQATVTLKASEAMKTPAIFESYRDATNGIAGNFLKAFEAARAEFAAEVQSTFQQTTLTNGLIASPNFGYFVTAFDIKNRNFPVPASLAATWAQGGTGGAEEGKYLELLMQAMNQPVRPDGQLTIVLGDTIRLVPVQGPGDKPSPGNLENGEVITPASIITLSQARAELRSQFSQEDHPFARALSELLKPDCAPDEGLTEVARERAIAGLVVDNHFDAGEVIVHRGESIDAKTKAALDELNEKLMPGVLSRQIAAEQAQEQREVEQAQHAQEQAELAQQQQQRAQQERDLAKTEAQREREQATEMRDQALLAQSQAREIHIRNEWLAGACGVISAGALAVLWWLLRQRRAVGGSVSMPATAVRVERNQPVVPPEFAPQLAQAVKEALVQELAAQRQELLSAQHAAAVEMGELVRRLDQLQVPLQERLRMYEAQIQQLEKELAARTEENRELLKMKIEMMRRQLETERKRVDFN